MVMGSARYCAAVVAASADSIGLAREQSWRATFRTATAPQPAGRGGDISAGSENSRGGSGGRSVRGVLSTLGPLVVLALVVPIGHAAMGPLNDLLALGQAGGQTPEKVPI